MWLLHTGTLALEEFIGDTNIPEYAILSHTWKGQEVSFKDALEGMLVQPEANAPSSKKDSVNKIKQFCAQARDTYGLAFGWVDTCCIDKSSSAELSEAINSMYRWYSKAKICIVYLQDVHASRPFIDTIPSVWDQDRLLIRAAFVTSRWFQRGWTLQELIAPRKLDFFSSSWFRLGTREEFNDEITSTTGIRKGEMPYPFLTSVARRMSWASRRETTRPEDMAYSLMGIFSVNMPLLYGEGGKKAFFRLQRAILEETDDPSLFAWTTDDNSGEEQDEDSWMDTFLRRTGLLASSPRHFTQSYDVYTGTSSAISPPVMTSRGLRLELGLHDPSRYQWFQNFMASFSRDKYEIPTVRAATLGGETVMRRTLVIFILKSITLGRKNTFSRIGPLVYAEPNVEVHWEEVYITKEPGIPWLRKPVSNPPIDTH